METVAFAVPDNIGRLMGKRVPVARYEALARSGLHMPDFHLITGIENTPLDGLEVTGQHTGFRDGILRADESTLRVLPWCPETALVLCDPYTLDGQPAETAPRWVLRRQIERLDRLGLTARCATELEFYLFRGSYERANRTDYRRLVPCYHFGADNDLRLAGRAELVIGRARREMPQAGIPVELSQGEGGPGQHEITLEHAPPLEMADRNVVYKHGLKEIAACMGASATFMAKVRGDQPGSSCHVHLSIADCDRSALADDPHNLTPFGRAFLAGVIAYTPELTLLHAPYANSYRRLLKGSWAPSNVSWGFDNRTTCIRVIGTGQNFRFEFRLPGADANPYLVLAGLLAAGLEGAEQELEPPSPVFGDGYASNAPRLPCDLTEAVAAFARSEIAERAFGREVRNHLAHLGASELEASRCAVTDWDLRRGFERA